MPAPPEENIADRLVVLEASRTLGAWTRHADQVMASIPQDISVQFTGGTAELDGVDVVHASGSLHPLMAISPRATPAERLEKTRQFVSLLDEGGVALVRSIFGPRPTAENVMDAESIRLLDDATTTFVVVDESTTTPDAERTVVIPYAELAERFLGYPVREQVRGRFLATTQDTPGAAAKGLLRTSFLTRTPDLQFRVIGEPDEELALLVETAKSRTPQAVSSRFELLSDAALIEEITSAELILLPPVDTFADLHLLMMALTFHRPVLVPSSPSLASLAGEVGAGWLNCYDGKLSAAVLDTAIDSVRSADRAPGPDLSRRERGAAGSRYVDVFRTAASRAKAARSAGASAGSVEFS